MPEEGAKSMTAEEALKKFNKTRRERLAEYVKWMANKAEFFNLYGLYGSLTPSKDERGQIVLAVKTADPETLVTTKWRIIVDEIVCDGAHGRATDKWHFHIYKCPMGYLKAISAALPSENGD